MALVDERGVERLRVTAPAAYQAEVGRSRRLGTNHLGHFLLTERLRPRMTAGHIVNVANGLHTRGAGGRVLETLDGARVYERRKYVTFYAYGDTKLPTSSSAAR